MITTKTTTKTASIYRLLARIYSDSLDKRIKYLRDILFTLETFNTTDPRKILEDVEQELKNIAAVKLTKNCSKKKPAKKRKK